MEKIKFLGVPFAFGQPHPGVRKAPAHFRLRGGLEALSKIAAVSDLGDIDFSLIMNKERAYSSIKNGLASDVGCELISQCIEKEKLGNAFLLNLGGDHGLALGSIHGILTHRPETVIIWADAHGDINPPGASLSGNFHGMPLSFLLGLNRDSERFKWIKRYLRPEKLILFGPRDLDEAEKEIIQELSIQYISSEDILKFGTEKLLQQALKKADPDGKAPLHLSFDVDFCDAQLVQATGTPVLSGPSRSEVMALGSLLGKTGRLRSMDVVELNPEIGSDREIKDSFNLVFDFLNLTLSETFQNFAFLVRNIQTA